MNLDLFDKDTEVDNTVCFLSYVFISGFLYGSDDRGYNLKAKNLFRRLLKVRNLRFKECDLRTVENSVNNVNCLKNIYKDCESMSLKQKSKMTWFGVNKTDLKYFLSFFVGKNSYVDELKYFIDTEALSIYRRYLNGELFLN